MLNSIQMFIYRKVVVLEQSTPVSMAARAMAEQQIGCIVVSDRRGHIIGIVTDRDLCCNVLAYALPPDTPIGEVMSRIVDWANESSTVDEVVEMMERIGVRRIPVVKATTTGSEKCIGIITLDDLVLVGAVDTDQIQRVIRSQIHQRVRKLRSLKSDERKEHTLNHFFAILAESMKVERPVGESLAIVFLKALVRRLPYTTAAHLIAQLPSLIQEDLLSLPAGPDRSIVPEALYNQLETQFGYPPQVTRLLTEGFWLGVKKFLNGDDLRHVSDQLPEDFRLLFEPSLHVA